MEHHVQGEDVPTLKSHAEHEGHDMGKAPRHDVPTPAGEREGHDMGKAPMEDHHASARAHASAGSGSSEQHRQFPHGQASTSATL